MGQKPRLDELLVEKGLVESLERAQALILGGKVYSLEQRLDKAGVRLAPETPLEVRVRDCPFVSRAGLKLEHGLNVFGLNVTNQVCLDIGVSTGGFTDCLLKRGAAHVVGVDVGWGQIHEQLRTDSRVTLMEKTNARTLRRDEVRAAGGQPDQITVAVADVSFISLGLILGTVVPEFPSIKNWVLLFKPQFEVRPEDVEEGGLVTSEHAIQEALVEFDEHAKSLGLSKLSGPERSPLSGKKSGNVEFLLLYARS